MGNPKHGILSIQLDYDAKERIGAIRNNDPLNL